MQKLLRNLSLATGSFIDDDEGAQVVEYALIIAVVSIALVLALQLLANNGTVFGAFVARVTACLTTATCT